MVYPAKSVPWSILQHKQTTVPQHTTAHPHRSTLHCHVAVVGGQSGFFTSTNFPCSIAHRRGGGRGGSRGGEGDPVSCGVQPFQYFPGRGACKEGQGPHVLTLTEEGVGISPVSLSVGRQKLRQRPPGPLLAGRQRYCQPHLFYLARPPSVASLLFHLARTPSVASLLFHLARPPSVASLLFHLARTPSVASLRLRHLAKHCQPSLVEASACSDPL